MKDDSPRRTITVDFIAARETMGFGLYGMQGVLNSVGVGWEFMTGVASAAPRFECRVVAAERGLYHGPLGAPITPTATFAEAGEGALIIAPDIAVSVRKDPRGRWPEISEWLRERYAGGAVIGSVCSGSLMLAEAGLLDGEEAATHWAYAGVFERCYPAVRLRPERILALAGADRRIVTSGGASSWQDLALYLVTRFCGRDEALRIARLFLFGDRSDGQAPFAAPGPSTPHDDRVVADAQGWIAGNYADRSPVARMVARSGLSERSFNRRFRQATGYAPVQYVQTLRIEEAKQILEQSDMAVDDVAAEIGYEDPTHFRRLFKRLVGVTPAVYRRRMSLVGAVVA